MIWHKASVYTSMRMEANMWDTGTKTSSMALEKKNGMIIHNIKAFTKMHPRRDKENIAGQMVTDMSANGQITC